MELDRLDVTAEVTKVFTDYEDALVSGDNERLVGYFWDAPGLVRYGLEDRQHGGGELRAWRLSQGPVPPGRALVDTVVATFGTDFAVVNTLFRYADSSATGRQSQTWVRLPAGWKIVSAHVSWQE
jgi:hypothetical protein